MIRAGWWIAAGVHGLCVVVNAYALAVSGSKLSAAFIGLGIVLGAHSVTKARRA